MSPRRSSLERLTAHAASSATYTLGGRARGADDALSALAARRRAAAGKAQATPERVASNTGGLGWTTLVSHDPLDDLSKIGYDTVNSTWTAGAGGLTGSHTFVDFNQFTCYRGAPVVPHYVGAVVEAEVSISNAPDGNRFVGVGLTSDYERFRARGNRVYGLFAGLAGPAPGSTSPQFGYQNWSNDLGPAFTVTPGWHRVRVAHVGGTCTVDLDGVRVSTATYESTVAGHLPPSSSSLTYYPPVSFNRRPTLRPGFFVSSNCTGHFRDLSFAVLAVGGPPA